MSTLFETYYDSLGHEMHIGDLVFIKTAGHFVIGNISKFDFDKSGNIKYVVIPHTEYNKRRYGNIELKKSYKVSDKNIFWQP